MFEAIGQFENALQVFVERRNRNARINQWRVAPEPDTNENTTRGTLFSVKEFSRLIAVLTIKL